MGLGVRKKDKQAAAPANVAITEDYSPDPRAMLSRDKLALYRHHLRERGLHPRPTTIEVAWQGTVYTAPGHEGSDNEPEADSDDEIARYRAEVVEAKRGIKQTDRDFVQYQAEVREAKQGNTEADVQFAQYQADVAEAKRGTTRPRGTIAESSRALAARDGQTSSGSDGVRLEPARLRTGFWRRLKDRESSPPSPPTTRTTRFA